MIDKPPEYVTLGEAAAILGLSRVALSKRVRTYNIPTFQGPDLREVLIRRSDLARWQGIRPMHRPVPKRAAVTHG